MRLLKIAPFLFAGLLFSCTRPPQKNTAPTSYEINLDSTYAAFPEANVVDYIALETSESSLIASLTKVIAHDDLIYIWDRIQKKVLMFDTKGRFVKSIHKIGQGPGEYTEPFDMDVDPQGNVYVYDWGTQSIIKYIDGDASQHEVLKIGEYCYDIAVTNRHIYLGNIFREGIPAISLASFDMQTQELKALKENTLPEAQSLPYGKHHFFRSDSLIYFYERFRPEIRKISNDLDEDFISFRSQKIPTDEEVKALGTEDDPMVKFQKLMQYISGVSACYETPEYICLTFNSVPEIHSLIRKTDGSITCSDKGIKGIPPATVCAVQGSHFLANFTPSEKNIEKAVGCTTDPSLQDKLKKLTEESNPVLVVFDIK